MTAGPSGSGAAARRRRAPDRPAGAALDRDTELDDGFRADISMPASRPGAGDTGFVTVATGWSVQAGVVPQARGAGVGAALVSEALRRMRAAGMDRALLDVDVDNPAGRLYRRIGLTGQGLRARFRPSRPSRPTAPPRTRLRARS
ncbi:MAG TPA: GNAT family N-acetyltransferase [Actinoplanes sp.]